MAQSNEYTQLLCSSDMLLRALGMARCASGHKAVGSGSMQACVRGLAPMLRSAIGITSTSGLLWLVRVESPRAVPLYDGYLLRRPARAII